MNDLKETEIAKSIARQVFEKRGNHTEIHISEAELAALIIFGFKQRQVCDD